MMLNLSKRSDVLRLWLKVWRFVSFTTWVTSFEADVASPHGEATNLQVNDDMVALSGQEH